MRSRWRASSVLCSEGGVSPWASLAHGSRETSLRRHGTPTTSVIQSSYQPIILSVYQSINQSPKPSITK
eukprot:9369923-Lingulodinium_polyedra.AAC.1